LATSIDQATKQVFQAFEKEAYAKWDFKKITEDVVLCQRQRRFVWQALTKGRFESWDWKGDIKDDGRYKYIRSQTPLDELERKTRYPVHSNVPTISCVAKDAKMVTMQPKRLQEIASEPTRFR
jgi:Choline sulfatase enzyme C terminal